MGFTGLILLKASAPEALIIVFIFKTRYLGDCDAPHTSLGQKMGE